MMDTAKSDRVCGNGEDNVEMLDRDLNFFFPPPDFSFVPKDMPVPSFMEATASIMSAHATAVFAAIQHANKLKQENKSVLDLDKTAAICLYTLEENGIYSPLNQALRDAAAKDPTQCQQVLEPWIKYLRLLSAALDLLPNVSAATTLYRGIKLDLEASYKSVEGQVICWPGFTSCTTSLEALSNPKFVGTTGKRTIFAIQCSRGKDIQALSPFGEGEAEVLIMATTKFRVTKVDKGDEGLTMVHLVEEEVDCGYPLLNIHLRNVPAHQHRNVPAPLCDKHGSELEYLCHDCGDKMACQKCVNTLPCSKHQERILLIDGISQYEEEARSIMDKIMGDDWQQDWQHTVDVMNKRINQAKHVGEQHRVITQNLFAKLHEQLDEMKESCLKTIDDAVAMRSTLWKSRCTEIAKMAEDTDAGIANVNKLLGDSKDLSRNVVERLNAAKEAIGASETCAATSLELRKQLMKWANYGKIEFVNNYARIGRVLEDTMDGIELGFRIVPDNDVAIDTATLNTGISQKGNIPVKLIELDEPKGLCRVSDDVIAVADLCDVSLISLSTRRIIRSFGNGYLERPFGICTNHDGHFIVADFEYDQLLVFDKDDGQLLKGSDPVLIKLNKPCGVCFDRNNKRVIVADSQNHRVLVLNEDLDTLIEEIGGTKGSSAGYFDIPWGVGVDSLGRIVVSELENCRIQIFEEKDDSSAARGKSYQPLYLFAMLGERQGGFNSVVPALITIDNEDRIIVCDGDSSRVQVFDSSANFVGCTGRIPFSGWSQSKCVGVCLDGKGRIIYSAYAGDENGLWTMSYDEKSKKRTRSDNQCNSSKKQTLTTQ